MQLVHSSHNINKDEVLVIDSSNQKSLPWWAESSYQCVTVSLSRNLKSIEDFNGSVFTSVHFSERQASGDSHWSQHDDVCFLDKEIINTVAWCRESLSKKCSYSESFWSLFSRICTKYALFTQWMCCFKFIIKTPEEHL